LSESRKTQMTRKTRKGGKDISKGLQPLVQEIRDNRDRIMSESQIHTDYADCNYVGQTSRGTKIFVPIRRGGFQIHPIMYIDRSRLTINSIGQGGDRRDACPTIKRNWVGTGTYPYGIRNRANAICPYTNHCGIGHSMLCPYGDIRNWERNCRPRRST
jgi:hypothetical protein